MGIVVGNISMGSFCSFWFLISICTLSRAFSQLSSVEIHDLGPDKDEENELGFEALILESIARAYYQKTTQVIGRKKERVRTFLFTSSILFELVKALYKR